jgi:hypothetical protein
VEAAAARLLISASLRNGCRLPRRATDKNDSELRCPRARIILFWKAASTDGKTKAASNFQSLLNAICCLKTEFLFLFFRLKKTVVTSFAERVAQIGADLYLTVPLPASRNSPEKQGVSPALFAPVFCHSSLLKLKISKCPDRAAQNDNEHKHD